ncbi:MAG: hypothetical protein AAB442_01430 [Patescibacteria group bacterium]
MTEQRSEIERIVMQRVHLIRALRVAISGGVLSTLVSFLAIWGIGKQVWVARVLENAPKDPLALPHFYWAAFDHTTLAVQALVVVMAICFLIIAREIARAITIVTNPESI